MHEKKQGRNNNVHIFKQKKRRAPSSMRASTGNINPWPYFAATTSTTISMHALTTTAYSPTGRDAPTSPPTMMLPFPFVGS